jgi:hypothetical protein
MNDIQSKRPLAAWILIVLLFFLGIGGVISGALLFMSPNGDLIGMSTFLLQGSPFPNFLIPGIILFLFVGVYQIFTGYGLLTRTPWNGPDVINPCRGYHWAWTASWGAGVIMLIWIVTETVLLGYVSALQPVITIWGIVLIVLTLLPSVRRYYRRKV